MFSASAIVGTFRAPRSSTPFSTSTTLSLCGVVTTFVIMRHRNLRTVVSIKTPYNRAEPREDGRGGAGGPTRIGEGQGRSATSSVLELANSRWGATPKENTDEERSGVECHQQCPLEATQLTFRTTAAVISTCCPIVMWMSPVPGGMSITSTSSTPQSVPRASWVTTPDTIGLKKWDDVIAIAHVSIYWIVECDLERGNDRGAPPPTMEDEANPASSIDATKLNTGWYWPTKHCCRLPTRRPPVRHAADAVVDDGVNQVVCCF